MSKKLMLLAAGALTALAFTALPAVASAGSPQVHCPGAVLECDITITGGHGELTKTGGFASITCTQTTGSGRIGTTTGTMTLLFHGCVDSLFGAACTTSGQSSKTITTTPLTFHTVYLTDNKTTPGVLITPNEATGVFAHFSCIDGNHTVDGNGVMGHLESGCNSPVSPLNIEFTQTQAGHQTFKQNTATGTIYDLTDGGATGAMKATGSVTTAGGQFTVTCV